MIKINYIDLFAGIGGFRRACDVLTLNGIAEFNCLGYSEIDPHAVKNYEVNYDTTGEMKMGDIVKLTSTVESIESIPSMDIVFGGFPCQSFSIAGNMKGFDDDRGQMFFRIIDILSVKRPRYVLLENVKNLINHDKGNTFSVIKRELEGLGYKVFFDIFNTADFHLAQRRNRVLIFATLEDTPDNFMDMFKSETVSRLFDSENHDNLIYHDTVHDVLEKEVDDKYFLSTKIKHCCLKYNGVPLANVKNINKDPALTLVATMFKTQRANVNNYYTEEFIKSNGENTGIITREDEVESLRLRKITPTEAFLLQGFPSDFVKKARENGISDTQLYRQAGNTVSVNVIYAVLYFLIKNNIIK